MKKIQRVSRTLQTILKFILIGLPLLCILLWFYSSIPNPFGLNARFFPAVIDVVNAPNMTTRILGFTVSLVPLGIEMFSIYCLIKLFNLFEHGKIFTLQNVRYIRYIGIAMIMGEIVKPFYEAISTLIIHYHNPTSHQMFSVSFSGDEISYILTGVIILLISWIMTEACKLQEEHIHTV